MGIFAWIKIRVLRIFGSLGYHKVLFMVYIFSQIYKKRENMYSAKMSTFTVSTLNVSKYLVYCLSNGSLIKVYVHV